MTNQFSFKLTHQKRSDNRMVGLLPSSSDDDIAFSYQSPIDGGQTFEMNKKDFNERFKKYEPLEKGE